MKFLIILLALALLVYMITRSLIRGNVPHKNTKTKNKQDAVEEMYQCAHCGIYVSQTESILADGVHFCSKDCLKKGAKQ